MFRFFSRSIALVILLSLTGSLAADDKKPPTKGGSTPNAPGGNPPVSGGGSPTSPGSGSKDPGMFADIAGSSAPMLYCLAGEPCEVLRHFHNKGAGGLDPLPTPAWLVNGKAAVPASIQQSGSSGAGWPSGDSRRWRAILTLPPGDHQVNAVMPRLANEKEDDNNVAPGRVIVGIPDMAVNLERDNVDAATRYEVKVEIENKGSVPTAALEVLAVMSINMHTGTPPTLDQCMADPRLSDCVVERHGVEKLNPGEKKRFKLGGKQLVTTNVVARAQVACRGTGACPDGVAANNSESKRFGP